MLKAYLQFVQAWIDAGCPDGAPFWRSEGLCGNCYYFTNCPDAAFDLRRELRHAFAASGLNYLMPFNYSYEHFRIEIANKSIYLNPQRLDWIKRHAQDSN